MVISYRFHCWSNKIKIDNWNVEVILFICKHKIEIIIRDIGYGAWIANYICRYGTPQESFLLLFIKDHILLMSPSGLMRALTYEQ